MAKFSIDKPVTTDVSDIVVDAGLKPGLHRFRLVVVDDTGQASGSDEALVQVAEETVAPLNLTTATTPGPAIAPAVAPLRPTIRPIVTPPKPTQPRTRRRPR
jgi:hypothetical protein